VLWAVGLKYSDGFRLLWPSLFSLCCIGMSYALYVKAITRLPVGAAYTVFTGIGAAGTAAAGMLFLGEPAGGWRIFFILLLLAGMTGLKLTGGEESRSAEYGGPDASVPARQLQAGEASGAGRSPGGGS
jgi:quaternary ammonium compound-resistance protein SugE